MVQDDDSCIQTLMELGLTLLQATVYLTLVKLRKADAKRISKASNVARSDIYRIMPKIEKMGLAEKILGKPTMYEATPIKGALSILLQNKKKEYAEIEQKTGTLLNNFHDIDLQDFQKMDSQFKVTSEWTLIKKMHGKMIQSAQTSIDITVPIKFLQKMLDDHGTYLKEAKKKGVKTRAIIQKVGEKTPSRKTKTLATNLFTEVEYVSYTDLFGMHIFDKKEATLNIFSGKGGSSLWSNDPHVVKIAETYFEHMWNESEINKKCLTVHKLLLQSSNIDFFLAFRNLPSKFTSKLGFESLPRRFF